MIPVIVCICIAVLVTIILNYNGYVEFYHPLNKAQDGQIRVACVGDSITYGCTVKNRCKKSYPAVLSDLLGDKYCVNNYGYTNRTAIKTADFPYVKMKLYQKSLDFQPDIVIIMLGANDSKKINWNREKFVRDYSEIIESYLSLPSAPKVYVLECLPMFEFNGKVKWQLIKDVTEKEINPAVKQIADETGVSFVGLCDAFEDKAHLFTDGVHPNSEGSELLAKIIHQSVFLDK